MCHQYLVPQAKIHLLPGASHIDLAADVQLIRLGGSQEAGHPPSHLRLHLQS
jgi:hypothetical protein